jgi:hypothetical protein
LVASPRLADLGDHLAGEADCYYSMGSRLAASDIPVAWSAVINLIN